MAVNETISAHSTSHDTQSFHYYDSHATEEDLMGESAAQSQLILYLVQVLTWLYRAEQWFVVSNLNIYRQRRRNEYPLAPDVAVFKGVVVPSANQRTYRSWRMYEPHRPAPQVVFEISSEATWHDDIEQKPAKYGVLGVHEYFAYDPNEPPYWTHAGVPLRGWRYDGEQPHEITPDARGWLWSEELQSWLVPDGALLRLHDQQEQQRLTDAEAARAAKEVAWAKLRDLGIDPEEL